MENLPSNRNHPKAPLPEPEKEKVKPVVQGEVIMRKPPLAKRVFRNFANGDASSVFEYVIMDVLLPAAKDMIADAASQGVERMIFGDSVPRTRRRSSSGSTPATMTNYRQFSVTPSEGRREEPRARSRRMSQSTDIGEIVLATRVEAEALMDAIFSQMDKYELVTVADLKDFAGISSTHTDEKWGWIYLDDRSVSVRRVREGFVVILPDPEPIS